MRHSAILEAASVAVPVINLGDRQKGRERNPNVLDVPWPSNAGVSPAATKPIEQAIHRALSDKAFLKKVAQRHNLYGDGHAAERIIAVLESLKFPLVTTKQFHDLRQPQARR